METKEATPAAVAAVPPVASTENGSKPAVAPKSKVVAKAKAKDKKVAPTAKAKEATKEKSPVTVNGNGAASTVEAPKPKVVWLDNVKVAVNAIWDWPKHLVKVPMIEEREVGKGTVLRAYRHDDGVKLWGIGKYSHIQGVALDERVPWEAQLAMSLAFMEFSFILEVEWKELGIKTDGLRGYFSAMKLCAAQFDAEQEKRAELARAAKAEERSATLAKAVAVDRLMSSDSLPKELKDLLAKELKAIRAGSKA